MNNLKFVHPPWKKEKEEERKEESEKIAILQKERGEAQWPLVPPQDWLMPKHIRLQRIVHEIANQNRLQEIDKDIYNVLQYGLRERVAMILQTLAKTAKQRRDCKEARETIEKEEKGERKVQIRIVSEPNKEFENWSRTTSLRQLQVEKEKKEEEARKKEEEKKEEGEEEEEEEEDDDEEKEKKVKKKKKESTKKRKRDEFDPVLEEKRANFIASHRLQDTGEKKPSKIMSNLIIYLPLSTTNLTSDQVNAAINTIDKTVANLRQRLNAIPWDYNSAVQLRLLTEEEADCNLNELSRKNLQELRWKLEAQEKLTEAIRDLEARKNVYIAGGPTPSIKDVAEKKQGQGLNQSYRTKEKEVIKLKEPTITMDDAYACMETIGLEPFKRFFLRRSVNLAKEKKARDEERNTR